MKKIRYNDTFIYVDDTPVEDDETGKLPVDDDIEEEPTITNEDILEKTVTDLWGNSDE